MDKKLLNYYRTHYFDMDKVVDYKLKNGQISIYPVLVEDINMFLSVQDILLIKKNKIPDLEIVKMSYLEFLKKVQFQTGQNNELAKFKKIFSLCLHEDYVDVAKVGNEYKVIIAKPTEGDDFEIVGHINNKEFKEIVDIIMNQNLCDYDDREVSDELKHAYDEYIGIQSKGYVAPTLGKKIAFVGLLGYSKKDILKWTYRSFDLLYKMEEGVDNYNRNKLGEFSGNVSVKTPLVHPLYAKDVDKYSQMFVNKEEFKKKTDQMTGQGGV